MGTPRRHDHRGDDHGGARQPDGGAVDGTHRSTRIGVSMRPWRRSGWHAPLNNRMVIRELPSMLWRPKVKSSPRWRRSGWHAPLNNRMVIRELPSMLWRPKVKSSPSWRRSGWHAPLNNLSVKGLRQRAKTTDTFGREGEGLTTTACFDVGAREAATVHSFIQQFRDLRFG